MGETNSWFFILPHGKPHQNSDWLQWNILGERRETDDGIKQFVRSCVPPTQRQIGNPKPLYSIDPSESMATGSVCASVCLCAAHTHGVRLCRCHVRVCVVAYVFLLSTKGRAVRGGGWLERRAREGGTPVSVCLRGGVGSVNAVSCSLSDSIHTMLAKFEMFFFPCFLAPCAHLKGELFLNALQSG